MRGTRTPDAQRTVSTGGADYTACDGRKGDSTVRTVHVHASCGKNKTKITMRKWCFATGVLWTLIGRLSASHAAVTDNTTTNCALSSITKLFIYQIFKSDRVFSANETVQAA